VRYIAKKKTLVQALLEGLSLSQPQPKISSELIKSLGKTYNAWHIVISLLESHVMLFPQVGAEALRGLLYMLWLLFLVTIFLTRVTNLLVVVGR
jgi:hypothetical protein